jgi:plasmid maintenance system antidote protein VapI
MADSKSPMTDQEKERTLSSLERFNQFIQEAEKSVNYWVDGPITEFAEDIWRLMEEQKVSRAELARRLGTSRAYVTKLLGGNANFTLETMTKVAMAFGCTVHVHVADQKATTRWIDEHPSEEVPAVSALAAGSS